MVTDAVNLRTDQAKKCRFHSWGSLRAIIIIIINNQSIINTDSYTQLCIWRNCLFICVRVRARECLKISVFMLWSFLNLKLWQIKHKLQVAVVPPIAWRQSQVNMATWRLWSNMIKTVTELRANRLHANGAEIHTKKKPTCSLKTWAGF